MKKLAKVLFSPILIVAMFVMFGAAPQAEAQTAGLVVINTQPCAVLIGGIAVKPAPTCLSCVNGTSGPVVVPAGGFLVLPPPCPAGYIWRYVKFIPVAGGPTGASDNPFNACPPVVGPPLFTACGGIGVPFTSVWLTPNVVIL